jgi:23S rRNA (guanosine2251-2'-O)-methyltransferase
MSTIIAGRKPVMEALRAGTPIEKIVFLLGVQGRVIEEIRDAARQRDVQCTDVNRQAFRELVVDATTQGVVAVVPAKQFLPLADLLASIRQSGTPGFLLVLDEIEDPHNFGALIRTAECAGAHGVVFPRHHAATVTSTVVKASAGATEHLPMAEVTNVVSTLEELKSSGFWIVGLDGGGDREFTGIDYLSPVALVVGNEGKGIRRLVREHCDFLARIPLYGKIDSLNASVAGALALFEVARQRRAAAPPPNE